GPGIAAGIAEEHQHAAIGRPGRALVVEALGEQPLALPVRLDHADAEGAAAALGERDIVAARRPHRRRIRAFAEADALGPAAGRPHDVDLLGAAALGLEAAARRVRRI